jgi:hypothetical protein
MSLVNRFRRSAETEVCALLGIFLACSALSGCGDLGWMSAGGYALQYARIVHLMSDFGLSGYGSWGWVSEKGVCASIRVRGQTGGDTMRRVNRTRRYILSGLAVLSLAPCAAICLLWMQRDQRRCELYARGSSQRVGVWAASSHIGVESFRSTVALSGPWTGWLTYTIPAGAQSDVDAVIAGCAGSQAWVRGRWGFYVAGDTVTQDRQLWVVMPTWCAAVGALLLPLNGLRRRIHRVRRAQVQDGVRS